MWNPKKLFSVLSNGQKLFNQSFYLLLSIVYDTASLKSQSFQLDNKAKCIGTEGYGWSDDLARHS